MLFSATRAMPPPMPPLRASGLDNLKAKYFTQQARINYYSFMRAIIRRRHRGLPAAHAICRYAYDAMVIAISHDKKQIIFGAELLSL